MAARKNGKHHHHGPLKLYQSYMFKTKDPVIDQLRTMLADEFGKVSHKAFAAVQAAGGPSTTSMYNWFMGETLRPQSASVEACGRAIGRKRVWRRLDAK